MTEKYKKYKKHYIDNGRLKELLTYHSIHHSDDNYMICDELAEMFMLLSKNLLRRPNFSGYSYKQDMLSDACYDLLKYSHNYNPDSVNGVTSNGFSYCTTIAFQSMVRRIKKEKKIFQGKVRYIQSATTDDIVSTLGNDSAADMESFNVFKELYEKNIVEEIKKEKEAVETPLTMAFKETEKEIIEMMDAE